MKPDSALPATTDAEMQEESFDEGEEISFTPGRYYLHQQNSSSLGKGASRLALSFGTLTPSALQTFKDVMDCEGSDLNSGIFSDDDNFELHNAKKMIALAKIKASMWNLPDSISLYLDLKMVYLLPEYRGRGVGSALAKGIGYALAENLIHLICEAEETGKSLEVTFTADFITDKGEEFFYQMVNFAGAIFRNHAEDIELTISIDAGY